ncbi:LamG domain-containing protein [Thermobifida halotolerans]|uniref:LamG domain-containing protein n=1 Tax=Thermobifida halotolerans TaxID=483545 RepID=A0AA97LZQ9_9ACTN|nr:LamG domain-containing protein [Thermobifida halotolerans]UOE21155.1 LamG domain-containing protein [Thermobifida halotolerans]
MSASVLAGVAAGLLWAVPAAADDGTGPEASAQSTGATLEVHSSDYPDDERFHGAPDQPGEFTFSSVGGDTKTYYYSLNSDTCTVPLVPDTPGGSVTVTLTPYKDGPNMIYARTVNTEGRSSACTRVYTFLVAPFRDPVAHFPFDEGSGTTAADVERPGETATVSAGVDWIRGRVGAVQNHQPRLEGTAVRTHGASGTGEITTGGPIVDTTETFTVAAWVKLDSKDANHTAVAQDGTEQSPFHLGYQHSEDAWVFKLPPADAHLPETPAWTYALSTEPARTGVWTHLIGTFDAATGEAALYVNGEKQGTAVHEDAWTASGPVTMGRGRYQGTEDYHWPGGIDDVRFYDRLVKDTLMPGSRPDEQTEVWRLANRFVALEGHWRLDDYEGTTVTDASDHALDATLTGDPATVWNTAFNDWIYVPAARLNGVDEYFATTGPAIRTDASFSVAIWVRLEEAGTDPVALSQDGEQHSGFTLGARNIDGVDRWVVRMPQADTAGSPWTQVASTSPAELDEWTHLAATFDATTDTLTLYVDSFEDGTATHTTPWHADGPVRIGAAESEGALTGLWPGDLAEAQVYQGVLDDYGVVTAKYGMAAVPSE